MFERLGVRPTYFVAHSVAVDRESSAVVADIAQCGFAEVGAHLHPWNTPPLDEVFVPRHTMLLNLPAPLQRAKLEQLTQELRRCLDGRQPRSFRAGRWAIGSTTVGVLLDCDYTIDSSVTPHTSWRRHDDGAFFVGAPVNAYRLEAGSDVRRPVSGGRLTEIPPSFGFNRAPLHLWGGLHRLLSSKAGQKLLLDRVAASSGLLRHVTLSPETDVVDDMIALSRALLASGARHLHLYLHSPSVAPGLTPFTRSAADVERLLSAVEEYFERIAAFINIRFATLSEAAALLDVDGAASEIAAG
jgi:hypothetical protein